MSSECRRWYAIALVVFGIAAATSVCWARQDAFLSADLKWLLLAQQSLGSSWMDWFMVAISALGYVPFSLVPTFLVAAVLWSLRLRLASIFVVVTVSAGILSVALKVLVARPRPPVEFARSDWITLDLGFPSGHAIHAVVLYGFLAFLLWLYLRRPVWRWGSIALLGLLVLTTGISRIYLGLHWPSDVIGGYLIGAFWLLVLIGLYLEISKRYGLR